MGTKSVLMAETGVLIRATIMAAVFSGVVGLITDGFSVTLFLGVTVALFIATNLVYFWVSRKRPDVLMFAGKVQDDLDGRSD